MNQEIRVHVEEIAKHFENIEDPRSSVNRRHSLVTVLVLAVMGVLAGAKGPTGIATWAKSKEKWLSELFPLPYGVPSKDVFRRVLCALKPGVFESCFLEWVQELRAKAEEASGEERPVLSVDGKTSRRSHDRSRGLKALHTVSVWAGELGLSLGQVATEEKSNEITAIPEVLRLVDLKGAIITIDAMGAQKAIADQIVAGGGDYVFSLKGNQPKLRESVESHLREHAADRDGSVRRYTTYDKGHGREETRHYTQMRAPRDLPGFSEWKGLRSIGMVVSHTIRDGKETTETRYFVSSLPLGVKQFARAVRRHWGIENSCHWRLDVVYREDESRIRHVNLRENMAWLNRFTLSLLLQHPAKDSVAMKRMRCAWSGDFLLQVLTAQGT